MLLLISPVPYLTVCFLLNISAVLSLPTLPRDVPELIGSLLGDHANVLVLTNSRAHQNITTAITQSRGRHNEHMLPLPDNLPPIPKLLFMCLI